MMKTTGIALLVIGLVMTLFTTFKYFTKEKVIDIGKVEITADKGHNVSWSPLIGIGIMIVGGVVIYSASKK
jgi:hypothetical protein